MEKTTTYMGLQLKSPIIVSACTLSERIDNIARMEENGAGAIVLFSLFEEQIRKEEKRFWSILTDTNESSAEASDFFPDLADYSIGTHEYMEHIRKAKQKVNIPVIASLNGITNVGWIDYSQMMEEAGADAIEVNVFFIPGDLSMSSAEVEHRYLNIVSAIKETVKIPVAVKLSPYFSSMGNMALRLKNHGADGLVLFNRFYQPDFDIKKLVVKTNLEFSEPGEIRLPLLWIALLHQKLNISLAATTGVNSGVEVIKYLLAGADVVMTASSLYKYGLSYLKVLNRELDEWMLKMGYDSVDAFRGKMSQKNIHNPTAYERANYIKILEGAVKL